jgi:hypothetical protein
MISALIPSPLSGISRDRGNVMKIELNDKECDTLREVLESYLSELTSEIAHTDDRDFRDNLKDKRTTIENIAQRLEAAGK